MYQPIPRPTNPATPWRAHPAKTFLKETWVYKHIKYVMLLVRTMYSTDMDAGHVRHAMQEPA
jgi:hypothetical protein